MLVESPTSTNRVQAPGRQKVLLNLDVLKKEQVESRGLLIGESESAVFGEVAWKSLFQQKMLGIHSIRSLVRYRLSLLSLRYDLLWTRVAQTSSFCIRLVGLSGTVLELDAMLRLGGT